MREVVIGGGRGRGMQRSVWCRITAGLAVGWLGMVLPSARAAAPSPLPELPLGLAGDVYAMVRQPDGGMVIGGDFSMIDGVQRSHLARLRADGSLDPDWNPSVDGTVRALAVDASGRVYVGGSFEAVDGEPRHDIARIAAGRHGDVDGAWNPGRNIDATHGLAALAVGVHGDVFAAGEIASAPLGGHHAVKISAAGLIDPQWNPTLRSSVHAISSDAKGFLYVVGGASNGEVAVHKVAETGHGDDAAGWQPAFDGPPRATAVGADGSLYVASPVSGFPAANGTAPRFVARIVAGSSGGFDPAWNPPCSAPVTALAVDGDAVFAALDGNGDDEPQLVRWSARTGAAAWRTPGGGVRLLTPGAGGSVYASGWALPARLGLARLGGADGRLLASADAAKPGVVHAIAVEPDGGKIVGGHFAVAGTAMRDNLLRLDPEGRLDPTWHPSTGLRSVDALAVGTQGEVYAGGESTAKSSQTTSMIVRVDGAGAIDASWNVVVDGWVHALAPDTHGALYVGGYFAHVADLAREHFARLSLRDASVLPAWGTPMFPVNAIVVDDAEDALYLADGYGTYTLPLGGGNSLARFSNATGSLRWRRSLPGMPGALALTPDGMLYVGGEFLAGDATNDVLAFSTAGEPDAPWNAATATRGGHRVASALLVDADLVVVGGSRYSDFPYAGTSSLVGRSRVDGSESVPPAVVDGAAIHAIARAPDGIYVGGEFDAVDGITRVGLAAFTDGPAAPMRTHSSHPRPQAPPARAAGHDALR